MPYHKRYHGDALTGFMPLTLEERGAYQTLLDLIYDRGGPIPNNERLLAGYMNCSIRKFRAVLESLVEKGKIVINSDGTLTNDRAEKEIENAAKTSRKLAESGSKGGRKSSENTKKPNENSETDEASLKRGSSYIRSQIPEASIASCAREAATPRERPSLPRDATIPDDLKRVMQAAGITRPPSDAALLRQWLRDGADLEGHILPVARKLGQRQADAGQAIHKLKYLDDAVMAEVDAERRQVEHFREVSERYGGGTA